MHFTSIWNREQDMEKQWINKENKIGIEADAKTDFPISVVMLDDTNASCELI